MNDTNNNLKYVSIIAFIAVVLGLGSLFIQQSNSTVQEAAGVAGEVIVKNGILTISGIEETLSYIAKEDASVLDILTHIAKGRSLEVTTKDYGALGVLVTAIGDKENGTDGKYWQYKVNGEMPQVGADVYVPKEGDVTAWVFEASTF